MPAFFQNIIVGNINHLFGNRFLHPDITIFSQSPAYGTTAEETRRHPLPAGNNAGLFLFTPLACVHPHDPEIYHKVSDTPTDSPEFSSNLLIFEAQESINHPVPSGSGVPGSESNAGDETGTTAADTSSTPDSGTTQVHKSYSAYVTPLSAADGRFSAIWQPTGFWRHKPCSPEFLKISPLFPAVPL